MAQEGECGCAAPPKATLATARPAPCPTSQLQATPPLPFGQHFAQKVCWGGHLSWP